MGLKCGKRAEADVARKLRINLISKQLLVFFDR